MLNRRSAGEAPRGRVLVADDDPAVRETFVLGLQRAGFDTCEAADGRQVIKVLGRERVDILVLDVAMPGGSGLEVIAQVRSDPASAALPIVLVTGLGDVTDRVAGLEAGANDYLVKPVHLDELVARVESHLRVSADWATAVESNIEMRAEVVKALCRLTPGASPEVTASEICRRVARGPGVCEATVIALTPDGPATVLAHEGARGAAVDRPFPLSAEAAIRLRERAESGQSMLASADEVASVGLAGVLAGSGATVRHLAPLNHEGGHAFGVLVAGSAEGAADHIGQLSSVIDYAAIASLLLGPALAGQSDLDASHWVVEQVIDQRAFHPVFQPIVELQGLRVVGFEALTRFADASPPDLRFAEAAQAGLGTKLEAATLTAALDAAVALPLDAWVSLNVSPALILERTLPSVTGSTARSLVLEITEHDPISGYAAIRLALERIEPRARLCVDDAGAGYSSLRHILALRPAFVKLDRYWVDGIAGDPVRQELISGLAHFASNTDSVLVAEGVEDGVTLDTLGSIGVTLAQGYFTGRPLPAEDQADLVTAAPKVAAARA